MRLFALVGLVAQMILSAAELSVPVEGGKIVIQADFIRDGKAELNLTLRNESPGFWHYLRLEFMISGRCGDNDAQWIIQAGVRTARNWIPPVREDGTIPDDATCQEAAPFSNGYFACGQPAVAIVYHDRDRRGYYMCLACADHNVRNRGGRLVGWTKRKLSRGATQRFRELAQISERNLVPAEPRAGKGEG